MLLAHMLDKKGITYLVTEIIFPEMKCVFNLPTKDSVRKMDPVG